MTKINHCINVGVAEMLNNRNLLSLLMYDDINLNH